MAQALLLAASALLPTLAASGPQKRRVETRRGTQKCVRHDSRCEVILALPLSYRSRAQGAPRQQAVSRYVIVIPNVSTKLKRMFTLSGHALPGAKWLLVQGLFVVTAGSGA